MLNGATPRAAAKRCVVAESSSENRFMQCPSCRAENAEGTRQCQACGARLPRKRRDSGVAREAAANPWIHSNNRLALAAYRCGIVSMIPFFGLLLGPLAIILGLLGRRSERKQPSERGAGQAMAAIVLGGATLITQWSGLFFLWQGVS